MCSLMDGLYENERMGVTLGLLTAVS
uniref:Uncharacterized protein n=1 Tax=Anguilla anguilla TaxID=7936 RepID=A0A0E9RG66_ANGAN